MAKFAHSTPYRSLPDRENRYDVYHHDTKRKVLADVPPHKASRRMNIGTDDLKWSSEEIGRADTDKHVAVPAGTKYPGLYKEP